MTKLNTTILQSLSSGLIGATVLTALHETARQFIDDALGRIFWGSGP
ncbi:hypothetical protein [Spirosoma sp. KNUC1025]